MGINHWLDLICLLVEIVEQSVVFTVPFNDWNKSEGKGIGEEEQCGYHYGNHKQNSMFPTKVLHISIIEPDIHITSGQVDCGICENINDSSQQLGI